MPSILDRAQRNRLMVQGIAKKTCDVLGMLNRFHSAVIDVQDFDAAVGDYAALLGCKPSWLGQNPTRGSRSALFGLANMSLEICDPGTASGDGPHEGLRSIRLAAETSRDLEAWFGERRVATLESTREAAEEEKGGSIREWTRLPIDPVSSRAIEIEVVAEMTGGPLPEAEVNVGAKAAIRDLDHVVVFSADAEATRAFYKDGLDLRLALDKTFEDRQVRLLFFRIGGVTIEIGSRLGAEPSPDAVDRFGGLAWEVEDVEVIRERLEGEGFDVSGVRTGNKAGTRVCTVRNPVYGVPTLLIEPVSR
jgi:catechol 2,3-dioxygenase-like lactoylglutathione lyase family enzyme